MAKISIIGAGSWGTALGLLLCNNGHDVTICSENEKEIESLKEHREHLTKLPGVKLPDEMKFTCDVRGSLSGQDILVMAKASPYVRTTCKKYAADIPDGQLIVNVAKGLEDGSLLRLSQVIQECVPQCEVCVLSGPSHAEEVAREIPTTCLIASENEEVAKMVQKEFMNPKFRIYTSTDVIGVEMGAALKNVMALAAGMNDGLGFGDNSKAALMTRGIAEMKRLGIAMGGKAETFAGLSGIGDLIVTCTSMHSRNRRAGILLGQGKSLEETLAEVKMVVEGVNTVQAACHLAEKYHVDLPITQAINDVLFHGKDTQTAVLELMTREGKSE